jgi:hypothetical protein
MLGGVFLARFRVMGLNSNIMCTTVCWREPFTAWVTGSRLSSPPIAFAPPLYFYVYMQHRSSFSNTEHMLTDFIKYRLAMFQAQCL